ncbi:MAG TPA: Ig-like domain-containing protein [Streptosporangiaceae bacterium]|nr:Ig-like domain-containing protein [Streptosporangiaceae bacterium]
MFSVRGTGKTAGQETGRPAADPAVADPAAGGPESGTPGSGGPGGPRRRRNQFIALGVTSVAVIALAVAYVVLHAGATRHGRGSGGQGGASTVAALSVLSVTPAPGARHADGSVPVMVQFNAPLAAGSPMPVIRPAVPGTWSMVGSDATFTATRALRPATRYTVTVPAGQGGVRTGSGALLDRPAVAHFTTRGYSPLRLGQLLSQLGYLPLTWSPAQGAAARAEYQMAGYQPQSQQALAFSPPAGTFTWQPGYPSVLASMWQPDRANVVLRGAVMAFQSEHGMTMNGSAGPALWAALFKAARKDQRNVNGYTYALASKALPESLTIWHNGRIVLRSLANTGIPVAPTADGTFPVYQRFRFQIMRGTNPDGSSYADPVSFVSYFNGGDAVHYFPRGGYGYQQSLGCVELPYGAAEQAYPYLTYGSLVTVSG